MIFELMDCENVLIKIIQDKKSKRNDVVIPYAMSIVSSESVNFANINKAILEKWSFNALDYIKTKAWKEINSRKSKAV